MSSHPTADSAARETIRTAHDRTLFVEAGAGTGKTTALVARVVHLVATGHLERVDQLAAITFTENAAAELRTRIREALETAAAAATAGAASVGARPAYDATQRERCRRAVERLDEAAITTLHGFAARILGDHALAAGLAPGFAVADAIQSQLDAGVAWRTFLDDLLDDTSLADHVLAGLVLNLRLPSLRDLAGTFTGSWDLLLDRPLTTVPLPAVDRDTVLAPLRRAAGHAALGPAGDTLTAYLVEQVVPMVAELEALKDPLDLLDGLVRLSISINGGSGPAWSKAGGDKQAVIAELKAARAARQAVIDAVGAAVTQTLAAQVQDHVLQQARRRQEEGRLDFHDLLVLARDLLRDSAAVRRQMHQHHPVVLVDEFQDTDPLQVELVCLIAGDFGDGPPPAWADVPVAGGRLFFVGDPKQSIYRFRRADVSLYRAVGDTHADGLQQLTTNFRSVPAVLRVVNDCFEQLFDSPEQVPHAELEPARTEQAGGPAVLLLGGAVAAVASTVRAQEAAHVVATLVRAKAEGWTVSRDGGSAAQYRDMAVLLPTRASLPALEQELQRRDVPYRIESRSLVWGTDAVRDVVTLLQAIANPADEIATVAALRHPGLACSDRHLVEWAAAGGSWSYLAPAPEGLVPHPVAAGMATLRAFHDLRWWAPVNELVERVVRELRMVELTSSLRRPRDHWRRLRFVVDQARAFCDAGGAGLGDFVAWAVDQVESEADVRETVVPEPDDDAVRILTVHGAKGLEFSIAVVAGLGIAPRTVTSVVWGAPPEIRLKKDLLQTGGFTAAAERDRLLERAEGDRLLYVAMTRAQDHLVLGGYHKPSGGVGSHAQRVCALLEGHADVMHEPDLPELSTDSGIGGTGGSGEWLALDRRADVLAAREALLGAVAIRVATSATALVAKADLEPEKPLVLGSTADADADVEEVAGASVPRRRAGSRGAAIGTAVHWVLEHVQVAAPSEDELRLLATAACRTNSIPDLVGDVVARVRSALPAEVVHGAFTSGRAWREVYVVAHDGERAVEGYIDLLVESPEGRVVVDYKTDRADDEAAETAKRAHYAPQLAAYRRALELAGVDTSDGELVFAKPGAPL